MRYIPEHERDTRYPLWYIPYECMVPWNQMRSVEDIQLFGVPSTGDHAMDRETATEMRNVQIPVEHMAELLDNGADIRLRKPEQHAMTIYRDITEHLKAWSSRATFGINDRAIPRADLRALDNLAHAIYPFAQGTMPLDYSGGTFASLVRKHGGIDRRQLLAQLDPEKARLDAGAQRNLERARMSDFFKR